MSGADALKFKHNSQFYELALVQNFMTLLALTPTRCAGRHADKREASYLSAGNNGSGSGLAPQHPRSHRNLTQMAYQVHQSIKCESF